jgi:hypothetical protein
MRIFYSFLIVLCSTILIILPVTEGIYAFETDLREDSFTVTTDNVTTTATVQLFDEIYDDDVSTLEFASDNTSDVPVYSSYNATTRALVVAGLGTDATRTLDVTYDIDAINNDGISGYLDIVPFIWALVWIAFPVGALVAIWTGKA